MQYIAQREEHAEQAFLATVKLKADGTRVTFSREDHDIIHLLGRADRILPNGWCLLPPLQSCGKGNAPLTELTTMFQQFMAGFRLLALICPRDRIG